MTVSAAPFMGVGGSIGAELGRWQAVAQLDYHSEGFRTKVPTPQRCFLYIGTLVMTKRPTSITILSWLLIVFGAGGIILDLLWMSTVHPVTGRLHLPGWWYSDMHPLAMWLFPTQWFFLAVCGAFMLRGFRWSRWMLVAWIGYHSFQALAHTRFELMFGDRYDAHATWELLVHSLLYATILRVVFRPEAGRYFRGAQAAVARQNYVCD